MPAITPVCLGLPTRDGNTDRGALSPANPAFVVAKPTSVLLIWNVKKKIPNTMAEESRSRDALGRGVAESVETSNSSNSLIQLRSNTQSSTFVVQIILHQCLFLDISIVSQRRKAFPIVRLVWLKHPEYVNMKKAKGSTS